MKKRFIGVIVALVLVATALPLATVSAQSAGPLDHVVLLPNTATVPADDLQQFTAVGEDSDNVTIRNVSYTWSVVAGGGTINNLGLFTAGNVPSTYTDTIQIKAVKGGIERFAYATVTVTVVPVEEEAPVPPGWSHGKKTGWNGGDTPPGWSKGKKTGWNGKQMPPGWSKSFD